MSNRTAATQALSAKFLGSVYLQSKNAAGENNQKAKLIQEQFVSNLDVVKKLRERMVQYDTKTPFMIPQGYSDTVSINGWEDRWDLSGEIIDLTINWGKLTLDHCCKWQRDFNGYSDDVDHISSIWTKDLLLNSMDPELRKVVEEKFLKLDAYQQGGITFLKILLDTVFKMSSMSEGPSRLLSRTLVKLVWPRSRAKMFEPSLPKSMQLPSGWLIQACFALSRLSGMSTD